MDSSHREDYEDYFSDVKLREEGLGGVGSAGEGRDTGNEHSSSAEDVNSIALEEYLASRLQQIGEVTTQVREVKGLKTGNGWDANQVVEQVFKIDPISLKRAIETAISSNRKLRDRISDFFRRTKEDVRIVGAPIVEYVPIWKVKGFHECYYIRSSSYKVNVKNDVVAVEVEGLSRNLLLERKHSHLIPAAIAERLQKLGSFLTNESKYFVVGDALELVSKRSESELVLAGTGRKLSEDEEIELTSWRTKRIFDTEDLKVRSAKVDVRESISKEAVLNKFRQEVVKMPERFKQILSNKLQITDLKRIYVPIIKVQMQRGLVPREIIVNGTSGEIADSRLLSLIE